MTTTVRDTIPPIKPEEVPGRRQIYQVYVQNMEDDPVSAPFNGVVLCVDDNELWTVWYIAYQARASEWLFHTGAYCEENKERAQEIFGQRIAANCWGATYRALKEAMTDG